MKAKVAKLKQSKIYDKRPILETVISEGYTMGSNFREQLIRFNELSTDVFGEERRISDILNFIGFDTEQVAYLQSGRMSDLIHNIDFALQAVLISFSNGNMIFDILYHRYGLFGYEKQTLEKLGIKYGITRERIRQIQVRILKKLRCGVFEKVVLISACRSLNIEPTEMLHERKTAFDLKSGSVTYPKGKQPFSITPEMMSKIAPQETPISLKEFVRVLNALRPYGMGRLGHSRTRKFLLKVGLLEVYITANGSVSRRPTEAGKSLGIFTEQREGDHGPYMAILYNKDAQQFLIDNIEAITNTDGEDILDQ